ncbi:hypothetical protein [Providencia sp. wls1922]|uniref:hypothetical protein n=1 Tax=Providencia sp. wls1922 TaxID=2675152 RepID=UPI001E29DFFF|nr:hypothetical protein [Providencia sp. wls1922]
MNKFLISACMIASSALPFNALAAEIMTSTPENMTCKEYVDLTPKAGFQLPYG